MRRSLLEGLKRERGPDDLGTSPREMSLRRLHEELVDSINLQMIERMPRAELRRQLRERLEAMVDARDLPLTASEKRDAVEHILDEITGLGPLDRLLRLDDVTDILINGHRHAYVERNGQLEKIDPGFRDDDHLLQVIHRIVGRVGRRIDESTPMVDARLEDGSRVNAVIPPAAVDGPMLSIRRFGLHPIGPDDLLRFGTMPEPVLRLLAACVKAKLNILISGGTGSGKTTLLNVLSSYVPPDERIVTVEDSAELQLQQEHVVRLETRPPNVEGEGELTARSLVRNALRMRPDRIIVGEIRGDEAVDMLQAMNTGHEGSLGTIHANSPKHALGRVSTMVGLAAGNISSEAAREMTADALDVVIQISRLTDGTRRLVSITEVLGYEEGRFQMQELFRFVQETVDDDNRVRGRFEATGVRPRFERRLSAHGLSIPKAFSSLDEAV